MDDTKIINGMFHTHIFIGLRCMTCDNNGLISKDWLDGSHDAPPSGDGGHDAPPSGDACLHCQLEL
jgi:hypothetical protein